MAKVKISISLHPDVLEAVDRSAAIGRESRTAVVERWLREASRRAKTSRLEADTAVYYESLSAAEHEDDASWAGAASKAFRGLTIDDGHVARTGRKARAPRRQRG